MRNSRKQSHHFEFSFLLMGWVIWERQCGSEAKEPTGIWGVKFWIAVTAAAPVTPSRQFPSPGPQILPVHTGFSATKPSPRDVKPGLLLCGCTDCALHKGARQGGNSGLKLSPCSFISLCTLVMGQVHLEEEVFLLICTKLLYGLVEALCEWSKGTVTEHRA